VVYCLEHSVAGFDPRTSWRRSNIKHSGKISRDAWGLSEWWGLEWCSSINKTGGQFRAVHHIAVMDALLETAAVCTGTPWNASWTSTFTFWRYYVCSLWK